MFHVCRCDYQSNNYMTYGVFATALEAVRAAVKLEKKLTRRWLSGQGEFPSVTVARIGGGVFFDLHWRWYSSIETRQWFRRRQAYLEEIEAMG